MSGSLNGFVAQAPTRSGVPVNRARVADQRARNIHVRDGVSESEFVDMRTRRDATLQMPVLILPSVQVNIRGGRLPEAESNGRRYLRLPLSGPVA